MKGLTTFGAVLALAAIVVAPKLSVAALSITTNTSVGNAISLPVSAKVGASVSSNTQVASNMNANANVSTIAPVIDSIASHNTIVESFATSVPADLSGKITDPDFCNALDAAFMRQSSDVTSAYAWNPTSYEHSLPASSATAFVATQTALQNLAPKSGNLNAFAQSRAKAMLRSALIALTVDTSADATTTTNLQNLRDDVARCVAYYSNDPNTTSVLASTNAQVSLSSDATSTSAQVTVTASKSQLTGNESAPQNPSTISSNDLLTTFAQAEIATNPDLRTIKSSGSEVRVSFEERGKLFGFIPHWITRTAIVEADGTATLAGGSLSSKSGAYTEAGLQASVDSIPTLQGSTGLTTQMQAEIIANIAGYVENK